MERRIQVVSSAIDRNFRRDWDIEELARLVNLSASRLRHLFKSEIGKSPMQYLKSVRMAHAEMLLRTTFFSVKEIMHRVGISNESHFGHEFKKAYALAPSKYRSAARVSPAIESSAVEQQPFSPKNSRL